jgi:DNA adenine methylase
VKGVAPAGQPGLKRPPIPEGGAKPFLKWAGGKWSLASEIVARLPEDLHQRTYREPFLGGGAVFFWLRNHKAAARFALSDQLADLVAAYRAVRDHSRGLTKLLDKLRVAHSPEHFYQVRERFNQGGGTKLERAAWLIYLNKTCFNGLYRTNRSGEFNVPLGRFANPTILDQPRLEAAARALEGVEVSHASYEHLLEVAEPGDVIYMDPPYVPVSRTSNFASYSNGPFGADDQVRLAELFRTLDERGCLLALSNSDAAEVHELYRGFDVVKLTASRAISAKGANRGLTSEVLVRNVARYPRLGRSGAR